MQSQELRKLASELKNNLSRLMEKRSTWESHWQEIADLMLPRKAEITKERARGDKRSTQIFDATGIHSLELLAASLHGMLTSSANRWFSLRYKEAVLNESDEAREWLEDSIDKMYLAFARSNFQQEIFENYHDLIAFGTSCLMVEEDEDDIIRFSARHIKEIYVEENKKGLIDNVYRKFKLTVDQAIQKFGAENLSKEINNTHKSNPYDEVEICHIVRPRFSYDGSKQDKKNMKFQSIYFEHGTDHIISVGGFNENPYVVSRYLKSSTEIYGRSPSMNALPDVKVLNKMVEHGLKAAAKQIDPPLLVPDDSMLAPIRMTPGSLNYYRSGSRDRIEPLNIGQNTSATLNAENARREAIARMFHVDQLQIQSNRTMTATEVLQRNEEKMRILGPVMGRIQSELLEPMINRVFLIMLRNRLFVEAPAILANQEIDIEYVSPMALAQKGQELQNVMRGLELFGSLAQTMPVMDYIDENGLVKQLVQTLGLPARMIKSDKEVQTIRMERQEAQQQQMQMQQQLAESEMAKNAAPLAKEVLNGPTE
ncbi:portal protein [Pelagibacteraceae bacterium]|nr:portal protein [Pelagibacteraceae bacterium]BAR32465.1 head-tail connector protein [uncultured Mediterranean phage uvMED]